MSERHWEHQTSQVHMAAAQQTCISPGVFSTTKGFTIFIQKWNRKLRVGTTGWGSTAQVQCDPPAVAVTWPYGDVLAGSKEFLGRSWKRALCCICRPVGKTFPGIWCAARKSAEIFIGNLDKRWGRPTVHRSASCRLTRGDVLGEALRRGWERRGQRGWSHWEKSSGWILCEYCLWEGKLELQGNTMRYRHGRMCKCKDRTVLDTGPGFRLEWQENP